jgi:hypothetical protein
MYVRNVKQLLRAADSSFDERRYGFGGILDLLRASQRDALLRLERDRQGVLRVFPGNALQRPATAPPVQEATIEGPAGGPPSEAPGDAMAESVVAASGGAMDAAAAEPDAPPVIDAETIETSVAEALPGEPAAPEEAAEARPKRRRSAGGGARKAAAAPRKPRATAKAKGKKKE